MRQVEVVGRNVARIDAQSKVAGKAIYANDLNFNNMIYGKVLRSPLPRARIKGIDISEVKNLPGITILMGKDIPGRNAVGVMIADQPVLADEEVKYVGEGVVLVGGNSEQAAEDAIELIKVDYEPLEPILDPLEATAKDAPTIHEGGNVAAHAKIRKGNVEKGFEAADVIVEEAYKTTWVEHAYMEPETAVAKMETDGRITVWACTQHTHYDRRAISAVLGISQNRVRIVQTVTGGGFGGKIWSLCQYYSALLAFKTGRPSKVLYTRDESILATTKRHPYTIEYKTGATKEGKLVAVEVKIISDTGPYMVAGSSVLARSVIQASGPYNIPNVKIDGLAVYTNNPVCGAMRGYGGPQVAVAHESQMDKLARRLEIDPIQLRLKNSLDVGSTTATGQRLEHSVGIHKVLLEAKKVVESLKKQPHRGRFFKKRGIGVGVGFHGIGSTRGGSQSTAFVNLLPDGSATVICGSVDIGQGSDTIMAQIAAEELGVSVEKVRVTTTDTDMTPDCESTSGSRVTYISGKAVQLAAQKTKDILFQKASGHLDVDPEELFLQDGTIYVRENPQKKIDVWQSMKLNNMQGVSAVASFLPDTVALDPETGHGSPCATYAFAGCVAEVQVDSATGQVEVLKLVSIADVGKAINPVSVEGQIEGGASMGIGYALMEEIKTQEGATKNTSFTDYVMPTAMDIQDMESIIIEESEPTGPYGAKGFSEVAVTPIAGAILNAIRNAICVQIAEVPATPE
ncbi:MAG: xanthine dehydrogenase family protein [Deltaproteobacteria bacterium]|nr:MAG: xanthine dehydrogenase family protein [Deltaproteobacteria bacterium]